jgi:DNA (cytosine-5)-methyltransferase 1
MNHLDLFSGIGGFSLALERVGFTTVGFCEVDPYCRLLLQKHWKGVTIHHDIKKLEAKDIKEPIDILTGGFPCQPYSVAGKQKGTNDDRYLWPDMFRVIKEVRPTWIIAENVRGIINIQDGMVFETVCTDLESEGFEVQAFIIPAAGVGAPHRREGKEDLVHRT